MRFPFFKTTRPETKETIKTAPAPTSLTPGTVNKLAATQRIPSPVLSNTRLTKPGLAPAVSSTPAAPAPVAAKPSDDGPTVTLKLASISSQIPSQVFSVQGQANLATATVALPVSSIIPQLATGKVTMRLSDLLRYCAADTLRSPLPPYPEAQAIVLPLEELIPSIPAELLNLTYDSEVTVDDPELAKLPNLIDEESIAKRRRECNRASLADTQPLARLPDDLRKPAPPAAPATPVPPTPTPVAAAPAPVYTPKPAPEAPKPVATLVVPARARKDTPEYVMISLKSILNVLPETVINCSRTDALTKAPGTQSILIPADPIVAQLRTGVCRMPVSVIVSLLPHTILAHPMPNLEDQTCNLPLHEIIPQMPANIFTDHLREPAADVAGELDIPDPFREKNAPAIADPAPVAPTFADMDEAALNDENFNIFSESKPASAAAEPLPVGEPVVEPVAEPVVTPEPVVAATPVPTPEPEPVAPVAEVPAPAPVVETPAPTVGPLFALPEPAAVVASEPVAELPAPADPAFADADMADEEDDELAASLPAETTPTSASPDDKKLLVDLNRCQVEDLMAIPGIGRALAQRIVDFRTARGRFESIEELRQVPGIGRKTYRALAGVQPRALNRLLGADHDGELSLQEIVRLTGKLPGIQGCMLALSDGLFLTGQLPPHLDQNTISVFAPQLFKKVGRYSRELKIGSIRRFTIFTDTQPMSIFKAGDVYLIIVHDATRFSKALLKRCERIGQEIARLSSQRVTV